MKLKTTLIDSLFSTILVFLALGLLPLMFDFDFFVPFKRALSDFQITDANYSLIRDSSVVTADEDIVVIDMEGVYRNKLAFAQLINILNEYEPKVLGLDLMIEKGEKKLDDLVLADALSQVENLVMINSLLNCSEDTCDSIVNSDSVFIENADIGYRNFLFSRDKRYNTVRDFRLQTVIGKDTIKAFSVLVAEKFNPKSVEALLNRKNKTEIINYRGNFNKYYFHVGKEILSQNVDLDFIKGKIVLLGVAGAFRGYDILDDLYFTPMNKRNAGRTFPDMSSLLIHANIVSMINKANYCSWMPTWVSYLIAIIICYLNMLIFSYICIKNKTWYEIGSLFIFVFESLVILGATVYVFDRFNYQMRLTETLFAIAVSVFAYQIYGDFLKPLILNTYNKIIHKR